MDSNEFTSCPHQNVQRFTPQLALHGHWLMQIVAKKAEHADSLRRDRFFFELITGQFKNLERQKKKKLSDDLVLLIVFSRLCH